MVEIQKTISRHKNDGVNQKDLRKLNKEITKQEIKEIITNSKLRKAEGCDDVHPFMIKFGGEKVKEWLHRLFNKIYNGQVAPIEWNTGIIIPIPNVTTN